MKINFIKDKEANLEKYDLLGTLPYVNTLLKIIEKANTPFTIGLFGGWGTGKSSIIKTIEEKLNDDKSSKVKVFVYDAWKYSKDSFRRTFLLELKNKFSLDPTEEFDKFYSDKHEDIGAKVGLVDKWWVYLLVFFVPILVINSKSWFIDKDIEYSTIIISLFISAMMTFIAKSFVQYKISITKPKFFAPEQFESIFTEAIQIITKQQNRIIRYFSKIFEKEIIYTEKVVIVIDNIDRCHKDLAFELLLTI